MAQCSERKRRTCCHVMPEFSLCAILITLQIWTITTKDKFSNGAHFFVEYSGMRSHFNRNAKIILPQFEL